MKIRAIIVTTLFMFSSVIIGGCMITWPVVDDLDHYKKWDTYQSIREEKNEIIENDTQEILENDSDLKAINNCVNSWNTDPIFYEDQSNIELHSQFENTEAFCTDFIKNNPMFYNDVVWINETWGQIWRSWENYDDN